MLDVEDTVVVLFDGDGVCAFCEHTDCGGECKEAYYYLIDLDSL